ncbi:LLM class flavin-dependent oxidoreductase [Xylanibacillus composti]|uniref:Luciferase-like domain-containing protein n=1 Tax=Xylanibacillus composti TaxID=1572762 RepID=A0A8J4M2N6_9BACL|nr:LLM class flavin-dependent oxidoreductase [Xylanibacillus composti]MDT9726131.1 LLM class flavin-dependent oxidoreductase [Xylanibacillus composti]GIQ68721.1 hypothetical protein XYCOK13_15450 [Xylanibacillus composti]
MSDHQPSPPADKHLHHTPVSVLDLAPIVEGGSASDSFGRSLDLARHAERWGFHRFWMAEHHNMPGIASSATSVLIGHVAGGTTSIRVGSGGIMLPNHAPLVIAEQFGTLESLYPGRIDLGLGRAPGTDQPTARALRRNSGMSGKDFPDLLDELLHYFQPAGAPEQQTIRAIPGEGLSIPIWLLGSSGFSAELASQHGMPFAFASHFAPDYLMQALRLYREQFQPGFLSTPYAMVGLSIIAADTAEEAHRLATSQQQQILNMIRGKRGPLQPPVDSMDALWDQHEKHIVEAQMSYAIIGDKQTVRERLHAVLRETQADEFIIATQVYDHQARLHSYELVYEIMQEAREAEPR